MAAGIDQTNAKRRQQQTEHWSFHRGIVAPGFLNPGELRVVGFRKRPQWEIYLDGD
jgi:hypothetical protein